MPSPIDKIVLTRKQDRRYKTTHEDCEEMRKYYKDGFTQKEIDCRITSEEKIFNCERYRKDK